MHFIKFSFILSTFLISAATVFSQDGPKPKIITSPPAQAVWTVNFSYTKTKESLISENKDAIESNQVSASDLERIDKIVYTVKKPVSCRITHYDGGSKSEAFNYEEREFSKNKETQKIDTRKVDRLIDPQQLFVTKFPGVEWVKPKLFVKIENAYGESCAYFREDAAKLTAQQIENDDVTAEVHDVREAWFSLKSGLPVAFREAETVGKFNFGDPATADVKIPQDVREAIGKYVKFQEWSKKREKPQ